MNKKLALFPMNRNLCAVARYAHLLKGYTLSAAMVLSAFNLGGEDISKIDGGDFADVALCNYDEGILQTCDVVFLDYNEYMTSLDPYTVAIDCATRLGIEVFLSRELSVKLGLTPEVPPLTNMHVPNALQECTVPVISVLTLGSNTNQFAMELAIRGHFEAKGYKVSQLGTHDTCQLFDFGKQPDFLYENRDASQKLLCYNQYVKNLIKDESPDLLILGVPEAIMKYNNNILLGMGIVPYIITNAVRSDVSVCSSYYGKDLEKYIEEVACYCNYRLDCNVVFFNVSNVAASPNETDTALEYVTLPKNHVSQSLSDETGLDGFHVFNALDIASAKHACEAIEDSLAGNVAYVV